jgi:hypothetical protein
LRRIPGRNPLKRRKSERFYIAFCYIAFFFISRKEIPMSTSTPPAAAWLQKMFEDFVYFPTTNWQRAFSPQINFGCNLQDQDTEQHVLNEVGSYGYQLSRIIDVLHALVARVPSGELTPQEQQDIAGFCDMAQQVDAAVEEKQGPANRGVTAGDIANLTSGLQALAHTDPAQYRARLDQLHAALPDFPETKSERKKT